MATITLAKLLKYQKRVAERLARVSGEISSNNSVIEGNNRDVNIEEADRERQRLVNHLIEIKLKKGRANGPIMEHIFRIAEIKGEISWLQGIGTVHGKTRHVYDSNIEIIYNAHWQRPAINKRVVALEAELDRIQELIDKHNYVTTVEIEMVNLG